MVLIGVHIVMLACCTPCRHVHILDVVTLALDKSFIRVNIFPVNSVHYTHLRLRVLVPGFMNLYMYVSMYMNSMNSLMNSTPTRMFHFDVPF